MNRTVYAHTFQSLRDEECNGLEERRDARTTAPAFDSVETQTFGPLHGNTGGVKYDQDKPMMDLLDPYAIEQLSMVLTFGAKKYAAHNWRKGISYSRLVAAALRHLFAFLRGEDKDPESGLPHVAHAMCCCMFILGMMQSRPEMDDRYKQ